MTSSFPAVPVARILSAQLFVRRSDGRPHIGCDCDPRADGNRPARRLCAADRLLRLHGGLAPLRPPRPQPLPLLPPPLHHHAHLSPPGGAERPRPSPRRSSAPTSP